jgi:hypothetical protein
MVWPGYSAFMLPEWLDLETLRLVALLTIFVLGLIAIKVLRVIRQPSLQIVATVLIFALGVSVWTFRDNLQDCAITCDCSVVGLDVQFSDAEFGRCAYIARN